MFFKTFHLVTLLCKNFNVKISRFYQHFLKILEGLAHTTKFKGSFHFIFLRTRRIRKVGAKFTPIYGYGRVYD